MRGALPTESTVTVHFLTGVHEPLAVGSHYRTQSEFYADVRRGLAR